MFKNLNRGISTPIVIGIIAILVIVVGGGILAYRYYYVPQQLQKTQNFICKYNDQNLCEFLRKFSENKPYFLSYEPGRQTTIDTLGNTEIYIIETDGKNLQITQIQNQKETAKLIIGNETLYKKDFTTNTWKKRSISQQEIDQLTISYYTDVAEDFTSQTDEFQKVSNESCESRQCFKYKVVSPDKSTDISLMFVYFDDKEYILRKVFVQYKDGSQDEFIPYYTYTPIQIP